MKTSRVLGASLLSLALLLAGSGEAARQSKISETKHNLSSSGKFSTHSTSESQICVFCHTPHGSDTSQAAPLWNKTLKNTAYTPYTSSSLDAGAIQGVSAGQPLGSSKLCLSCHDGVTAIGSVRLLRGQKDQVIGDGTGVTMPTGSGATTGFTRMLDKDLTNDHPISVTLDATLSDRDGELRRPTMTTGSGGESTNRWGTVFGVRRQHDSFKPMLPLEPTGSNSAGQVQCTTCHDPHINETDLSAERNIKFLRANRFQKQQPTDIYSAANDIVCLACHDKGMMGNGKSWAYSVHAHASGTQVYKTEAADTREFPSATSGAATNIKVWQVACLNCHDTHTVAGARRLLREGVDSGIGTAASGTGFAATNLAGGGFMAGTTGAALEQTCYQCHTNATTSIVTPAPPNIAQDFGLNYRMRIRSGDQPAGGTETHDVGGSFNDGYPGSSANNTGSNCSGTANKCGADLLESRLQLGNGSANNRHVECSDCHNPHRVVKQPLFYGNAGDISTQGTSGTHTHTDTSGYTHTNVASGALRGSWGVEPSYTCCSFHTAPTNFTVRRGDPGSGSVPNDYNADTKDYVTREYQVCLKCHSNYGYGGTPPNLDTTNAKGLTPAATSQLFAGIGVSNGLTQYTNQAKEFQAPSTHQGEGINKGTDAGSADANFNNNNHRSWHPVMGRTNRPLATRGITKTGGTDPANYPWRRPWLNAVGDQTMYCSDCHGSDTSTNTAVPNSGNAWGPHGSGNPFILKGKWDYTVGQSTTSTTGLCFKCHDYSTYADGSGDANNNCEQAAFGRSGFRNSRTDLHCWHRKQTGKRLQCTWCHVAVPHGWKNKAFLVNLNDVGEEAGQGVGSSKEVSISGNGDYYTQAPYYLNAKLKIYSFAASGSWSVGNCGSRQKSGTGLTTGRINSTNGNSSQSGDANSNGDKKWMVSTCSPPTN